ncbi:hypothetical protein BDW74DRAFT_177825 [Aspergillus multicolor]|uniref:uncharacterized protein n=1 Tax=Aspergillus multicolor TaxID=41759 RepID=UPI003CCD1A23
MASMVDGPKEGLSLPRLLCLHGGGTNGRIFRAQCRVLRAQLKKSFRLVFVDAPWPSEPGPEVESVYGNADWGPFRSWLAHADQLQLTATEWGTITGVLSAAISKDDKLGATGAVVGLLGFSQGARMAASLLLDQQMGNQIADNNHQYRFAILLAGRGPLLLSPGRDLNPVNQPQLELPTVHVHGLQDPNLQAHRELFLRWCKAETRFLVEWDGGHRVPITTHDVAAVVTQLTTVAAHAGVSVDC